MKIKITCDCGHSDDIKNFISGRTEITEEGKRGNRAIIQEFVVTTYKCPSCSKETETKTGGSWDYKNAENGDEEIYECEECGIEITEFEYDENNGRCDDCASKDEDEDND